MATRDSRMDTVGACFGCGQAVDDTALEVWASTGGPVVAVLCDACRADATVCEALAGHLLAHAGPGTRRIAWETGDRAAPLAFAPATKGALLERLAADESFAFSR